MGSFSVMVFAEELQNPDTNLQVQGETETSEPVSQHQSGTTGQMQQQPEELADIQQEEPTFFDPETVPDSVPIPEANWVFEVPLDVKNLPEAVQMLGITCRVFKFKSITLPGEAQRITFGYAKKRVQLTDGEYAGNVIIGVSYDPDLAAYGAWGDDNARTPGPEKAEEYECKMYLIGPDSNWEKPKQSQVSPPWRHADPDQAFRWKTGRNQLP
ncbi:MAG: hypothetical protein K9K81_11130 [Desulfobacteraceae bacterium]|nr:hypothetical protein [Desulfobacteraceae bacterium]